MVIMQKNICDEIFDILTDFRSVDRRKLNDKEKAKIELLIDSSEFGNAKTSDGKSIIIELIPRGLGPLGLKLKNKTKNLSIDEFVALGDIDQSRKLIEEDPNLVHFKSSYSNASLLHVVNFSRSMELMELLIDKGSDVNVYCEDYLIEACQPIIYSVLVGNIDAVKLLLKSGGDVNSKELGSGVTPLHISTNNGMKEMTEFLLENGGDPLIKTTDGRTPLDNAVKKEFKEIIEILKEHIDR